MKVNQLTINFLDILRKQPSLRQTKSVVALVGANSIRFNTLLDIFLQGNNRISHRALPALEWLSEKNPALLKPHFKQLINNLSNPEITVGVKRDTIRWLQFLNIPKSLHGRVLHQCFSFLQDPAEPIAIKAFSMTVLANLSKSYPEIIPELEASIKALLPVGSPAIRSRGIKLLRSIELKAK